MINNDPLGERIFLCFGNQNANLLLQHIDVHFMINSYGCKANNTNGHPFTPSPPPHQTHPKIDTRWGAWVCVCVCVCVYGVSPAVARVIKTCRLQTLNVLCWQMSEGNSGARGLFETQTWGVSATGAKCDHSKRN